MIPLTLMHVLILLFEHASGLSPSPPHRVLVNIFRISNSLTLVNPSCEKIKKKKKTKKEIMML
jgi:hypothetical protein